MSPKIFGSRVHLVYPNQRALPSMLLLNNLKKKVRKIFTKNFLLSFYGLIQSMESENPIELYMPLCLMMWSFVVIFFNCEIGQDVRNQCNELSDAIYRKCHWYILPRKLQRMLIIIIANAHQPVSIRSFGNIECTRDSFKQVNFLIHKNAFVYIISILYL